MGNLTLPKNADKEGCQGIKTFMALIQGNFIQFAKVFKFTSNISIIK